MSGIDLSTLNQQQLEIATTLGEPLFVSAGAGSGKTFTLTKRIAYALSEGSGIQGGRFIDDLSQVLVITFTNAAARDIKEKVRSALRDAGPEFREFALQVDSAWISTIHGMCSRILRRNALDLGLDPEFKVATTNDVNTLYNQALEETVGEAQKSAQAGSVLSRAFREYDYGRSTDAGLTGVLGIVDAIIAAAKAAPGGFDSLCVGPKPQVEDAIARVRESLYSLGAQRGLSATAQKAIAQGKESLDSYFEASPGERTPELAQRTLSGVKMPRSSKAIAELLPFAKRDLAEARMEVSLARAYPFTEALIDLAEQTNDRFDQLKHEHSLLDNDDLISKALSAMQQPEIRAQYEGRFRLVMVDEFQDTDQRQLDLIGMLAGEGARHLTTVGDSQQSIYRFRGADVSVFRGRARELPEGCRKKMDTNYRSHADVLKLVDRVCDDAHGGVVRDFMSLKPHERRPGEDGYAAHQLPRVSVELVQKVGRGGSDERAAVMAACIADRLARYRDAGQAPGGMALLLGATRHAGLYIDALRERGLECVVSGGSTFTSAPEVQVMATLLHTLANWHDTQEGLFPLLESPMFGLDANDFVLLGTGTQPKLNAPAKRGIEFGLESMEFYHDAQPSARLQRAHDVLVRARELLSSRSVADVCLMVVRESGWLGRLEAEGSTGRAREANVIAALGYIRDLTEDMGLGPARAAQEFDVWLQKSKIAPATLSGGKGGAVQIMTVHASKGLEFPVVAVAECWAIHPDAGNVKSGKMAMDGQGDGSKCLVVLEPRAREGQKGMGSLAAELRKANEQLDDVAGAPESLSEWDYLLREREPLAEQEEKTRLLYVALTRAVEALVVGISFDVTKAGLSPELAARTIGALWGEGSVAAEDLPPIGESRIDYGGSEPALVRHVVVRKEGDVLTVDSGGSLELGDSGAGQGEEASQSGGQGHPEVGPAGEVTSSVPAAAGDDFVLYVEPRVEEQQVSLWGSREGVYSFSSAHQQLLESFSASAVSEGNKDEESLWQSLDDAGGVAAQKKGLGPLPTPAERESEEEGSAVVADADKATSLGSAFHELAQGMVETGRYPSAEHVAHMADYWHLSPRARQRLEGALKRWWGSEIRKEALRYDMLRAEVPFFSPARSAYGDYVEGAIDLLATMPGGKEAFLVDYKTGDVGLSLTQVRARHAMQANFYARVLMDQGFEQVLCNFVCVERENEDGEPLVVGYRFDGTHMPVL